MRPLLGYSHSYSVLCRKNFRIRKRFFGAAKTAGNEQKGQRGQGMGKGDIPLQKTENHVSMP
jgi:hypothetical protein